MADELSIPADCPSEGTYGALRTGFTNRREFLAAVTAAPAAFAAAPAAPDWRQMFQAPDRNVRPITWYFPSGPDPVKIAADLAELKKLGLGGVCIMPATSALKVPYLSEGYWETIRITVDECARLDFRVWLYDEIDYPSSSAGGAVIARCPECVVTALEYRDGKFTKRVGDPLAEIAKGRAGLVRPLGNLLDANAVREFINTTYEGYARVVGRHFGKTIEAMFTDEPCLHTAGYWNFGERPEDHHPLIPWVDGFPEYFFARKGYDIMPKLECLMKDCGPETTNVRCDYWEVACDLIVDSYFKQLADWCERNKIAFSGHQLLEEGLLLHLMFSGSFLRNASRQHIPGMDLIGTRQEGVSLEDTMTRVGGPYVGKMLSSAAHTRGHSEVMSESFAASGYEMTLEKIVAIANWQFATGVTEIMPMGRHILRRRRLPDTEEAKRFLQDDFFKDPSFYGTYLGRCKALLTGGTHLADIAMLVPEVSIWANYVPAAVGLPYEAYRQKNPDAVRIDDAFLDLSMRLLRNQLDYDYLDDEAFLKAEVKAGKLHLAGESYSVLVLPASTTMRCSVAQKVAEFRKAGGRVVVSGELPKESMERGKTGEVRSALQGLTPVPATEIAAALRKGWTSDISLADFDPKIFFIHKRHDARHAYFFCNMADAPRNLTITFHRMKGAASIANPRTGRIEPAKTVQAGGGVKLSLPIEKLSAMFVLFG